MMIDTGLKTKDGHIILYSDMTGEFYELCDEHGGTMVVQPSPTCL